MKKVVVRVLLVVVIIGAAVVAYYVIAGTQVVVTSQGCGPLQPPVALPLAWQETSTGGIATLPPWTVTAVTTEQNGQDTITATGPVGVQMSFAIASNVTLIQFDGMPLYRRSPLLRGSMSVALGKASSHHLLLVCR